MNSTQIAAVKLTPLNLPMRQPFVTALGKKRVSKNLLVTIQLASGIAGTGEASESLAWAEDSQAAMEKVLRRAGPSLIGKKISSYRRLIGQSWEIAGRHPTAAAALECALLDAYTRANGSSIWRWLGKKRRFVATCLTLSAWEPAIAARAASKAVADGFSRLKVKVTGPHIEEDIARVTAVHRAAPRAQLWMDANQGYTAQGAIRLSRALRRRRVPIRLFEQPVPKEDLEGLAQVAREAGIPVAADESARSVEEARRLIRRKTVSILNVKLAKCGILGALQIMQSAQSAGVQLMIGCMAESAVGLTPSVHLACGTGAFHFVDLDSHLLVVAPHSKAGFSSHGPKLSVVE